MMMMMMTQLYYPIVVVVGCVGDGLYHFLDHSVVYYYYYYFYYGFCFLNLIIDCFPAVYDWIGITFLLFRRAKLQFI